MYEKKDQMRFHIGFGPIMDSFSVDVQCAMLTFFCHILHCSTFHFVHFFDDKHLNIMHCIPGSFDQNTYILQLWAFENLKSYVLSIGYTETKYIKLKTKFQIFCCWHFDFFIHFWKRGKRKLFPPSKKTFSCPRLSNGRNIKKISTNESLSFWLKYLKKNRQIFIYTNKKY